MHLWLTGRPRKKITLGRVCTIETCDLHCQVLKDHGILGEREKQTYKHQDDSRPALFGFYQYAAWISTTRRSVDSCILAM
jgi:hypothetical protein